MCTPFDNITWKIGKPRLSHSILSGTDAIPTSPYPEHKPPLRSYTQFMINISDCGTVKIDFKDAPLNIQNIWQAAQNVYYDEVFSVIRGELMYDRITGEQSNYFGSHFIITYNGKKGTGGSVKHLTFCFNDEDSIAVPTSILAETCGKRGSWPADDF